MRLFLILSLLFIGTLSGLTQTIEPGSTLLNEQRYIVPEIELEVIAWDLKFRPISPYDDESDLLIFEKDAMSCSLILHDRGSPSFLQINSESEEMVFLIHSINESLETHREVECRAVTYILNKGFYKIYYNLPTSNPVYSKLRVSGTYIDYAAPKVDYSYELNDVDLACDPPNLLSYTNCVISNFPKQNMTTFTSPLMVNNKQYVVCNTVDNNNLSNQSGLYVLPMLSFRGVNDNSVNSVAIENSQ
jgi:hypothetical protein